MDNYTYLIIVDDSVVNKEQNREDAERYVLEHLEEEEIAGYDVVIAQVIATVEYEMVVKVASLDG